MDTTFHPTTVHSLRYLKPHISSHDLPQSRSSSERLKKSTPWSYHQGRIRSFVFALTRTAVPNSIYTYNYSRDPGTGGWIMLNIQLQYWRNPSSSCLTPEPGFISITQPTYLQPVLAVPLRWGTDSLRRTFCRGLGRADSTFKFPTPVTAAQASGHRRQAPASRCKPAFVLLTVACLAGHGFLRLCFVCAIPFIRFYGRWMHHRRS